MTSRLARARPQWGALLLGALAWRVLVGCSVSATCSSDEECTSGRCDVATGACRVTPAAPHADGGADVDDGGLHDGGALEDGGGEDGGRDDGGAGLDGGADPDGGAGLDGGGDVDGGALDGGADLDGGDVDGGGLDAGADGGADGGSDDGGSDDGDAGTSDAGAPPSCGDGHITPPEQCDDGNTVNGDGCDVNCRDSGCGNGAKAPTEECDDGNLIDGDNCDSDCTSTRCGNGIKTGGEACDDGNQTNNDGCDNNCTFPSCGNDVVDSSEECDDGNTVANDGCQPDCLNEGGALPVDPATLLLLRFDDSPVGVGGEAPSNPQDEGVYVEGVRADAMLTSSSGVSLQYDPVNNIAVGAGTWEAWVRCVSVSNSARPMFDARNASESVSLTIDPGGQLLVLVDGSVAATFAGAGLESRFHHVALTWKQGGEVLYVDGELKATAAVAATFAALPTELVPAGASGCAFDEVRITDGARTTSEILQDEQLGLAGAH
jgi:cysteine-rich repeat protein